MADWLAGIGLGCDLVAAVVLGLATGERHREASGDGCDRQAVTVTPRPGPTVR